MSERWKIDELAGVVRAGLDCAAYDGQSSARVRSVPDLRTIRYYTTMGLLDKPLEMRGRTALYGRRHVLQLVAVKRLQARGMSLEEVQAALAGADNKALTRRAGLPAGFWATVGGAESEPEKQRPRERFWTARPQFAAEQNETLIERIQESSDVTMKSVLEMPVAPGVRVVVEGLDAAKLGKEELAALAPALNQLKAALAHVAAAVESHARRPEQAQRSSGNSG